MIRNKNLLLNKFVSFLLIDKVLVIQIRIYIQ